MNPVSVLLGTFLIWIAGRGKMPIYWAFATGAPAASPVPASGNVGPALPALVAPGAGSAGKGDKDAEYYNSLQGIYEGLVKDLTDGAS